MDPRFRGLLTSPSGFQLGSQSSMNEFPDQTIIGNNGPRFDITSYPDQIIVNGQMNQNVGFLSSNQPFINDVAPNTFVITEEEEEEDCRDDLDFSDAMLQYIDNILMEEDMEDKTHMLQESLDLQAKERSFYEVLGKKYPPSPQPGLCSVSQYGGENTNNFLYTEPLTSRTSSSDGSGYLIDIVDPSWNSRGDGDIETSLVGCHSTNHVSRSSIGSCTNLSSVLGGISDSPVSPLQLRNAYAESQSVWSFMKGVEEANKFLPSALRTVVNVDISSLSAKDLQKQPNNDTLTLERKGGEEHLQSEYRGKKKCHVLETDLEEERSSKLAANYADSNTPAIEFDNVLLHTSGDDEIRFAAYREGLKIEARKALKQNGQVKALNSSSVKGRGKKQKQKKEVIDLRTLLISCAQAVAADDRRNSNELLQQIRKHSSPFGDGNQRLAYYFADGLEARLAGTGSQIHKSLVNKRTTAADYLKAYYTYLACSPFRKISNFASNKTIINSSLKSTRVHVIDFGILYGFQYPTLIQKLSELRVDGPPRLRITGIDFPQPGFRPADRIEDTGRRLARYAEKFNVPFEYNAIAKSWESITVEDLKIEEGEFIAVTCLYRTQNLLDETVVAESSRAKVLNMIRKINPSIFIHGIVNGAYSAPFFVTRFREVLFHFSALFDMLENNVPREKPERLLIERDIFGREALNVIACEGWERVERPETYKQWQVRDMKAGFSQIPFRKEIMNGAIQKVSTLYHKDFVIDEDSKWMLLGWKGRIIYAISCWKPA